MSTGLSHWKGQWFIGTFDWESCYFYDWSWTHQSASIYKYYFCYCVHCTVYINTINHRIQCDQYLRQIQQHQNELNSLSKILIAYFFCFVRFSFSFFFFVIASWTFDAVSTCLATTNQYVRHCLMIRTRCDTAIQ